MKIHKFLCTFMLTYILCATSVYAGVIGEVLHTDIGTLIDDSPIESYNINDYTYVVAEDLEKYGFDVVWNGDARTLSIYRNIHKGYEIALHKEKINIKKSDIPMRKHYCDVYETDIKTYLDGKEIDAFNVDGRTMIQVDHLAQYGEFYYDDSRRMVEIRIMKPTFERELNNTENKVSTVVSFYPGKYKTDVDYLGVVNQNGEPDGIGKVSYRDQNITTYSRWKGYVEQGNKYSELVNYQGISARVYGNHIEGKKDTTINIYGTGDNPYNMVCTHRYEVSPSYSRDCEYDDSFLYGFRVTGQVYYDKDGSAINYTNGKKVKFEGVMADKRFSQIAYVKTADGNVYAAGYSGATEDTGWETTGLEYKVFTKTNVNDFPKSPVEPLTPKYPKQFSAADAGAYNRIFSRSVYGDVYYERRKGIWSELRIDQSDKLDLSNAVKVFDNAKYVNIQLEDVGTVTGTAYIPYFYVVDNNNVLWHWNYEYYGQDQIGNIYDENNGYIVYGRVEYIKEPIKISENVVKAFGTEEKHLLKKDGRVVKLTDRGEETILTNVKDMDADMFGQNFIALKNDGTVWTWGKNQNGQCGVGHTDHVWQPMEIKEVYEMIN